MRSPLLVLLPALLAMVLAPAAPVYTASKEPAKQEAEAQAKAEPKSDTDEQAPKTDENKKRKDQRVPDCTYWCELTPVYPTGDGPVPDETEPGLCPEPAPELSARRLPAVLRFPEPPTEPDRISLRSGHLALPPPVA